MRIAGLGSSLPSSFQNSDTCGANPCNWWDDVYARDACVNFLTCAYPNDPTTIGFNQGVGAGAGAAAGEMAGGVIGGIGTGLAGGSMGSLVIISVAVLGAILLLKK